MQNEDKIRDLAKKLKALADRGIGGEKYNAQQKLDELLKKHGIRLEDIADEKKTDHLLRFKSGQAVIARHVVYLVIGYQKTMYVHKLHPNTSFIFACTEVQYLEILALCQLYFAAWKKEVRTFMRAFIQQNDLALPPDTDTGSSNETSMEERRKIAKLMAGIDQQQRFKKLLK